MVNSCPSDSSFTYSNEGKLRVLLSPRRRQVCGQDFFVHGMVERCNLTPIYPGPDFGYELPPGDLELVVSQNLQEKSDAECVLKLPDHVPIVAHFHYQWTYFSESQRKHINQAMRKITTGILPATFLKNDLDARFPGMNWRVVRNGVPKDRFKPSAAAERSIFRRVHGVPEDSILTGYVGRLENAKGFQVLEYLSDHLEKHNIHLLVQYLANDKDPKVRIFKDRAEALASKNRGKVHIFADRNPYEDRPVRYLDTLLLPSLSEVSPLVVLESLMSGVPFLGTNCTPFYDELIGMGISKDDFALIAFPDPLLETSLEGSRMHFSLEEIRVIGDRIIAEILARGTVDDAYRRQLSRNARMAGMDSATMYQRFNAVYEDAISLHKARIA